MHQYRHVYVQMFESNGISVTGVHVNPGLCEGAALKGTDTGFKWLACMVKETNGISLVKGFQRGSSATGVDECRATQGLMPKLMPIFHAIEKFSTFLGFVDQLVFGCRWVNIHGCLCRLRVRKMVMGLHAIPADYVFFVWKSLQFSLGFLFPSISFSIRKRITIPCWNTDVTNTHY